MYVNIQIYDPHEGNEVQMEKLVVMHQNIFYLQWAMEALTIN